MYGRRTESKGFFLAMWNNDHDDLAGDEDDDDESLCVLKNAGSLPRTTLFFECFQQMQDMEEKRVTKVQSLIMSSAEIERQVMPIISKCIDGMTAAAAIIDCKEVSFCY